MPIKNKPSHTTKTTMPPKLRLKLANESENLLLKVDIKPSNRGHKFYLLHSKQVNDTTYERMMTLFESLMREMYENSSWGWKQDEKMAEWSHSRTRIMIVTKNNQHQSHDNLDQQANKISVGELPKDDEAIIGFMCFRYEVGADKNECAFYVYEIHVEPEYQRQGLGKELMRMARLLAEAYKMDKIMLTSFRSNLQALKFYNKLNFHTDKSSPAQNEADYTILSSKLKT